MPGIEPGASYMQSMRSTTELHPLCGRRASRVAPQYIWWHGLSKLSKKKRVLPTARLELAIFGLGDRRRIHWATRAGVGCLWQEQHPVLLYPILKESMQGQRSPDQKPKLLPWKSSCWLQAKRRQIQKQNKKKCIERDRTRTCNPQIRSLMPYPLGHTPSRVSGRDKFQETWLPGYCDPGCYTALVASYGYCDPACNSFNP